MPHSLTLVLLSAALLGFRHGFDYDHIAAITDIAGVENRPRKTMRLGLMYALGHAATVAVLGGLVIGLRLSLPAGMDRWAERLVGFTLIVLAVYVFATLLRSRGRERPKSRAALILGAGRSLHRALHRWTSHRRGEAAEALDDLHPQDVNAPGCLLIGVIHGLGAETPSQLALFLLAANLGGARRGFLGLAFFLLGLLTMNTLMTASAAGLFNAGRNWRGWYPLVAGLTAAYSFTIGVVFLTGYAGHLANISG